MEDKKFGIVFTCGEILYFLGGNSAIYYINSTLLLISSIVCSLLGFIIVLFAKRSVSHLLTDNIGCLLSILGVIIGCVVYFVFGTFPSSPYVVVNVTLYIFFVVCILQKSTKAF